MVGFSVIGPNIDRPSSPLYYLPTRYTISELIEKSAIDCMASIKAKLEKSRGEKLQVH